MVKRHRLALGPQGKLVAVISSSFQPSRFTAHPSSCRSRSVHTSLSRPSGSGSRATISTPFGLTASATPFHITPNPRRHWLGVAPESPLGSTSLGFKGVERGRGLAFHAWLNVGSRQARPFLTSLLFRFVPSGKITMPTTRPLWW